MSTAVCSVCGRAGHVYMAIQTDGAISEILGEKHLCLTCARVIALVLRSALSTLSQPSGG